MRTILFLTGTRADYGKLKPLIDACIAAANFNVHLVVTGMHLEARYGLTVHDILKAEYPNVHTFSNQAGEATMDRILAKTIEGLSAEIGNIKPDLIVVHGDRVEALAGAIVGALNNILVAHIEGGEVSGTIDELIRHSVSKLSHIHYVSNETARRRLLQMGERADSIFVIGSPDIDIMLSDNLPSLEEVKDHYDILFESFGILLFHPVTTESDRLAEQARNVVSAVVKSGVHFVVIYPNNDKGTRLIFEAYKQLLPPERFRVFPSIKFEAFLTLMKHCRVIVGNSSAGVREAPYYGTPCINVGTRQLNRVKVESVLNCGCDDVEILGRIREVWGRRFKILTQFGTGNSAAKFLDTLIVGQLWEVCKQKQFVDMGEA